MSKDLFITQGLCDHVRILLQGGATMKNAGMLTGISQSTVSRIKAAGFSAAMYALKNGERREKDQKQRRYQDIKEQYEKGKQPAEGQQKTAENETGQLMKDLPEVQKFNPDSGKFEPYTVKDINTMMRFIAAMTDKVLMKLDQLNDTMSMVLRAVRKE